MANAASAGDTVLTRLLQVRRESIFCNFVQAGEVQQISYAQLLVRSAKYAERLRSLGVRPGQVSIIILKHSPDLYYSFFGSMMAGCIPSILPFPTIKQDPKIYWTSQQALLERISAGALITYADNVNQLLAQGIQLRQPILQQENMREALAAATPASFDPAAMHVANPNDTALLQHSSGTTGLKKGVQLSHRAILLQLDAYAESLALNSSDSVATWLPLYHDMGLIAAFLLPALAGLPVVALDAFEWVARPRMLLKYMHQFRSTLCWLPNFAYHHIAAAPDDGDRYDLGAARAIINCSEPCRPEAFSQFLEAFAAHGLRSESLQTCYAMAETVYAATQSSVGRKVACQTARADMASAAEVAELVGSGSSYLSSGKPIAGVQIRIVDALGQPLPDGQIGEIEINAPFLFSGYMRDEAETARKLRAGWYHSGDVGFLSSGELYVIGRNDDVLIYHGRKYFAPELEEQINLSIPGIKAGRTIVLGITDKASGANEIVVLTESSEPSASAAEELKRSIQRVLRQRYDIVAQSVSLVTPGWILKSTSGKLCRAATLNKYLSSSGEEVQTRAFNFAQIVG